MCVIVDNLLDLVNECSVQSADVVWQEQFITKYLSSLLNCIHSNMSSTSFQLFCEMLLLSVNQCRSETLLFANDRDVPEVFHRGYFVSLIRHVLIRAMGHGWQCEMLPGHLTQLV